MSSTWRRNADLRSAVSQASGLLTQTSTLLTQTSTLLTQTSTLLTQGKFSRADASSPADQRSALQQTGGLRYF